MSKKQKTKKHKETHKPKEKSFLENLKDFYFHEYKKLFLGLMIIVLLSFSSLVYTYVSSGDFIRRDVSLKGGVSITINTNNADVNSLQQYLEQQFPQGSLNIRTVESGGSLTGIIIEASDIDQDALVNALKQKINMTDYSAETMGSSLGESFFRQMFVAVFLAFLGMGLVFHFYFRNIYATMAALVSAFLDIAVTLGIMDMLGVRLTAGGIAAYLMLIGYSIDTSILISTKFIKERHELKVALFGAMKTGLTMSAAGLAATGISFILTNNPTLKQIMLILVVGLVIDVLTTWVGNVSFLRYYFEKKENVKV
jgi:preprotein translocase subunit SecF